VLKNSSIRENSWIYRFLSNQAGNYVLWSEIIFIFVLQNPLDFAPDRNISSRPMPPRKVEAVRSDVVISSEMKVRGASGTSNNKKAGLNQDKPKPKSIKLREANHSARTAGLTFKPSNRLKLPHRVLTSSQAKELSGKVVKITAATSSPKEAVKNNVGKENETDRSNSSPREKLPNSPSLDLAMQPKGSVQYVSWSVLKRELEGLKLNVFCFMRSSRPVVFVAKASESPYVTSAENIKDLPSGRFASLPPTIESLLTPRCSEDLMKYAILTHNGIAWEITGKRFGLQINILFKIIIKIIITTCSVTIMLLTF